MTLLRTLVSDGKEPSSSPCSKSGRAEINCARKMPLKYHSQRATDHSGIYISSAVYFLLPQKRSTISALFQHNDRSLHWIAMEDSWRGGSCIPDVHRGRSPMLGHAARNTLHIGMFMGENSQATDDRKGRETPCLYPT